MHSNFSVNQSVSGQSQKLHLLGLGELSICGRRKLSVMEFVSVELRVVHLEGTFTRSERRKYAIGSCKMYPMRSNS
jgi:hypothetical protein